MAKLSEASQLAIELGGMIRELQSELESHRAQLQQILLPDWSGPTVNWYTLLSRARAVMGGRKRDSQPVDP